MLFSFGSYIEFETGMGFCRAKKYDSILLVLNVVAVVLDVLEVGVQALVSVSCSTWHLCSSFSYWQRERLCRKTLVPTSLHSPTFKKRKQPPHLLDSTSQLILNVWSQLLPYRINSILISRFIIDLRSIYLSRPDAYTTGKNNSATTIQFAARIEGNVGASLDDSWATGEERDDGEDEEVRFSENPFASGLLEDGMSIGSSGGRKTRWDDGIGCSLLELIRYLVGLQGWRIIAVLAWLGTRMMISSSMGWRRSIHWWLIEDPWNPEPSLCDKRFLSVT